MKPLLQVENLSVSFQTDEGRIRAVQDTTFYVGEREAVGLVGESGCGKSVTGLSILRLISTPPGKIETGRVIFAGLNLLRLSAAELCKIRGRSIGMIFQEPTAALSPLQRIERQMEEALRTHEELSPHEAREIAEGWLERVGIPDPRRIMKAYPHHLSGGMCQRVMIAMVLILHPSLIIADEPTTALDVTIQAQILDLLRESTAKSASLLLITHDMGIIWEMCTRLVVMYAGEVMECGMTREIFQTPLHPYTEALLASIPPLSRRQRRLAALPGQVPSPFSYPPGCRFRDRCRYAFERCTKEHPAFYEVGQGRGVRCFLWEHGPRNASQPGPRQMNDGKNHVSA
ncbi:MAG: ABC transporter ATP-binding protein [Kiritimatiellia bacterium]